MLSFKLTGALIIALPAIMVAWVVLWRRNVGVFWLAVALIAMGTGYLMATGTTDDIGRRLVPEISAPPPVRAK